jgi:peptide/nickel transport system substrate-binding protein
MKPKYFYKSLIFLLIGLVSCNGNNDDNIPTQGKGGVWYGSILNIQSPEKVSDLFPESGTNKFSRDITFQIFESLLRFDTKTMETVPGVAKSFTVSSNGLKYVLKLRNDVYFHPNACFEDDARLMTAEDVKFSLDFACSGLPINKSSFLLINRIKGAKAFHAITQNQLTKPGVSGIKISGKNQITIELEEPFAGFEKILTHSNLGIIAKEAYEMYGSEIALNPVGTGPFMLDEFNEDYITLKRFPKYWRSDKFGNKLPYLAGMKMSYYSNKQKELQDFQNEKTDIVFNIPVEEINHLLGSLEDAQDGKNVIHKVFSEPSMSVTYIGFANESKEFSDVRVRKAFNLAINTRDLVNTYLGGEGWPASNGFIPPLEFYPNKQVKSTPFDTIQARRIFAEAGFPNGKGFPTIEVYVNAQKNSRDHNLVMGIKRQLYKHLGVKLTINLCSIAQRDKAIADGKAKMWRAGWIADYPYPENFLSLFYSRNIMANNNTINSYRYKSKEFDDLLEQANKEQDEDIRNQLFVKCDQKIVDDAVVMPILTGNFLVLTNRKVKNFRVNPMELLDISTIFIKAPRIEVGE